MNYAFINYVKASKNGEKIKLWHNHFQELLGSTLNITDDDEEILPIHNELNIYVNINIYIYICYEL